MSKEKYTLDLEPLLHRLSWLALDYKLFKGFVAEFLEESNIANKTEFFKGFEEYAKKHQDDVLQNFYEGKTDLTNGLKIKIQT